MSFPSVGSTIPAASPSGSVFLDENTASSDKTLHVYPGLYHEIFNEPEQEEIFSEIIDKERHHDTWDGDRGEISIQCSSQSEQGSNRNIIGESNSERKAHYYVDRK